jgi:GT2 family glycosyltransferase/glycosyltransferase involved in cell wall biosynthesis
MWVQAMTIGDERSAVADSREADARQAIIELQQRLTEVTQRLHAIETSSTWRATRPLRGAGQRFPFLTRNLRRGVKLAWWTVTLQLPRHYRSWRHVHRPAPMDPVPTPVVNDPTPSPRAGDIRIPSSGEPVVSVIIPSYGQVGFTLACLRSIADHPPNAPVEVIVVDDAYSGFEDVSILHDVTGIRLLRNTTNFGFLLSCNQAARSAKGRYIHLLNNDTELQPGAIDALAALLDARPDVGLAGSKLLFADGRLQEAGGILWADASGWNYGRGDDPSRPEYNYVREVDYCSGASIMVRRTLFESLGGFDEAFAPAYYEDADLAFRIRARGLKVVYEPRSVVVHHEGMSHGTDVTTGGKAHQVTNQARMLARWVSVLEREHYPNGQHVLRARDRGRMRKLALVVDHYVPQPDRDAGSRTMRGIIDSLVDAGWVVKFWPQNRAYDPIYTTELERQGIEVLDHRWPGDLNDWLRENGGELDHLLVSRPTVAVDVVPQIAHMVLNTNAKLSFYGHDVHFARVRHEAAVTRNPELLAEATRLERLERLIWRCFDLVLYPSEEEAAVVRAIFPTTLARSIVPFCYDTFPAHTKPIEGRSILFVAGFAHPPNVDAAVFLVNEILPQLEQDIGPVKLVLAGSNPTEAVQALAGPNVEVTGYVTDEALCQLYDTHRVSIVPLRFGAGVKGKVIESLSHGLPLVTTSIGAQGLPGLEEIVPVRDDVPGIVAALKLLLTDDAAWLAQSAGQMSFAQRFFSRAAMQRSVLSALEAGREVSSASGAAAPSPCMSSDMAWVASAGPDTTESLPHGTSSKGQTAATTARETSPQALVSEATRRFLAYYGLNGDGFVDDPYEVQGAHPEFTGRIRRIRLLPDDRIHFGNIARSLLHATMLARVIGADQIECYQFELGPTEPIIQAQEMSFSFGPFPGPAETALAGSFFNTFVFEGCLQGAQPPFIAETIEKYLRPVFHHHVAAAEPGAADAIVLNFRSGSIFNQPPASSWYVQPPASFYAEAFETARQHLGVARAVLVYEDRRNPAVAATEAYLRDRGVPVEHASGGPERDLRSLLGAAHIAAPFSTFTEAAALLSPNLRSYFAFRVVEAHAHQHPRRIEPLLASVLRERAVRAFVISDTGDYIEREDWRNTQEQQRLIAEYPADRLTVSELRAPELVGDRLWLDAANNEVLRLRSALRAARDEEVRREALLAEERRTFTDNLAQQENNLAQQENRAAQQEREQRLEVGRLQTLLSNMESSMSWRVTAPLRHAMELARKAIG